MPSLVIPKEIQETLVVPSDEREDPCRLVVKSWQCNDMFLGIGEH